jgi:hypothetical protein
MVSIFNPPLVKGHPNYEKPNREALPRGHSPRQGEMKFATRRNVSFQSRTVTDQRAGIKMSGDFEPVPTHDFL